MLLAVSRELVNIKIALGESDCGAHSGASENKYVLLSDSRHQTQIWLNGIVSVAVSDKEHLTAPSNCSLG